MLFHKFPKTKLLKEKTKMLAKDIKIKNIMTQRAFIMAQLSVMLESPREDGNSAYTYVGHIYPENRYFFRMEGFNVAKVESDMLMAATKGIPVYLFTPNDRIELTEEEFQEAEKYQRETEAKQRREKAFADEFLGAIFGGGMPDDEDSEDEDDEPERPDEDGED